MKSELTIDDSALKRCPTCKMELPLDKFHKDSHGKFGRSWQCKECRNVKPEDRKPRTGNLCKDKRICRDCGNEFQPTSNRQFRCPECKRLNSIAHCRDYYKRTYVHIGRGHLKGKGSPNYRTGIGSYMELKKEIPYCERCKSEKFLCVHHKDRNRNNNERDNLEVLCKACHQKEHLTRDENGRFCSNNN